MVYPAQGKENHELIISQHLNKCQFVQEAFPLISSVRMPDCYKLSVKYRLRRLDKKIMWISCRASLSRLREA